MTSETLDLKLYILHVFGTNISHLKPRNQDLKLSIVLNNLLCLFYFICLLMNIYFRFLFFFLRLFFETDLFILYLSLPLHWYHILWHVFLMERFLKQLFLIKGLEVFKRKMLILDIIVDTIIQHWLITIKLFLLLFLRWNIFQFII